MTALRTLSQEHERIKTAKRRSRKKNNGGKMSTDDMLALKKKYKYTCLCCGRKEPEIKITIDHILPLKFGGKDTVKNAQPLCTSCNSRKGTKYIDYRPAKGN